MGGNRRLEVLLERFPQVCESLFLGSALACDINIEALGNEPLPLRARRWQQTDAS
jgi:hypothetical protein